MMSYRSWMVWGILVFLQTGVSQAWVNPAPLAAVAAPSLEEARGAFLDGRALMEQQKWAEAADKFVHAAKARNTPGLRYYIAYCLEQQGLLVEAHLEYQNAERLLETQDAPDVQVLVEPAIRRLKDVLPHLVIHGLPAGATVSLDAGAPQQRDSMFVNPGSHELVAQAPGYTTYTTTFVAQEDTISLVQVDLRPTSAEPIKSRERNQRGQRSEREHPAGKRALFWSSATLGVLGVAAGAVGTGLFVDAGRKVNARGASVDALGGGADNNPCRAPAGELVQACRGLSLAVRQEDTALWMMIAGYGAGAVGILGAVATELWWPQRQPASRASALRRALELSARPARGGGMVTLRARF